MKIKALTKAKDTAVRDTVAPLGLTVRGTRHVERPGKVEGEVVVEELATIELPDGSSITVDISDPDYLSKVERAASRITEDIAMGRRARKIA